MGANVNAVAIMTLTQANPATNPATTLRCHLAGDDALTGGGARWAVSDRARRRSTITWAGTDLHQLVLPLLLDGMDLFSDGVDRSVERECTLLWSWTQPLAAGGEPAKLLIDGPIVQPPYRPWFVVEDLEWGDRIRGEDGQRIQQQVKVTLREHLAPTIQLGPAAAARAAIGR